MYDLVMRLAMNNVPLKRRIELQSQLTAWYRKRPSKDNINLLLYNELRLLDYLTDQPNKSTAYRKRMTQECLNRYRWTGNEQLALFYEQLARYSVDDTDYLGALAYCDSAIARWPKSEGGVGCANCRRGILTPVIELTVDEVSPAGRDLLARVRTRNAEHLFYRVIKYPEWFAKNYESNANKRNKLLKETVVRALRTRRLSRWTRLTRITLSSNIILLTYMAPPSRRRRTTPGSGTLPAWR